MYIYNLLVLSVNRVTQLNSENMFRLVNQIVQHLTNKSNTCTIGLTNRLLVEFDLLIKLVQKIDCHSCRI